MATCVLGAGLEAVSISQVDILAVKHRVCRVSVCSEPFLLPLVGIQVTKSRI